MTQTNEAINMVLTGTPAPISVKAADAAVKSVAAPKEAGMPKPG